MKLEGILLEFRKGNHFASPLCQVQNDIKRGTSPSSNGWDFIPNIDGQDESVNVENNYQNHIIGIKIFQFPCLIYLIVNQPRLYPRLV